MKAYKIIEQDDDRTILEGYLAIWGGPDARDFDGEYFHAGTDFESGYTRKNAVLVDWEHGLEPDAVAKQPGRDDPLGLLDWLSAKTDDIGLLMRAVLDRRDRYVRDFIEPLAAAGMLGGSSEAVAHQVIKTKDGRIDKWPLRRHTLTVMPADPRQATDQQVALIKSLSDRLPGLQAMLPKAEPVDTPEGEAVADATAADVIQTKTTTDIGDNDMDEKKEQAAAVDLGPVLDAIKGVGARVEDMAGRVADLEKAAPAENSVGVKTAPAVIADTAHWKYDNVPTDALGFMVATLDQAKRDGRSRGGVSQNAVKALAMRLESEETARTEAGRVGRQAMKSAGIKANELGQSNYAAQGDEWVGVYYSGALWESIRHATAIVNMLPMIEVPAGAESITIPLESTDPVWYKVAQAASLSSNPGGIPTNTVTASPLGTSSASLTLAKMGARVLWTGELEEDAVLPYVAQLRNQLAMSAAEYLESAVIDGDTETANTTNINDIAGQPGGTEYWMTVNGFRKSALITTTANSRSGGALTSADFLETVKLMGVGGANAAVDKVGFIIGNAVHYKALELADVKSRDVFNGATIESGRLAGIYGYPVYVSHHLHKAQASRLANASGLIDLNNAGNNTTGSILAVRWDQWQMGFRRRMSLETTRIPAADSTEIVALMRFGLIQRDTEASAISYNVTV